MDARNDRTARSGSGTGRPGTQWAITLSTLIFGMAVIPGLGQQPPDQSERPPQSLQSTDRAPDQDQPQKDLLMAQRWRVLTALLGQVRQQQANVEAALRAHPDGTEQGRALRAELQALNEQSHILDVQRQDLSQTGQVEVTVQAPGQPAPQQQEQAVVERPQPAGGPERARQQQELDHMAQRMQTQLDQIQQQVDKLREQTQQQQEQNRNEHLELRRNLDALRSMSQGAGQQPGATREEIEEHPTQEGAAQTQSEGVLQQQRGLGVRVNELEQQLRAAERRGGNEVTALRDELGRIRADLTQVQQRLGQIESGEPQPPDDLRGQVNRLQDQVRQLQEDEKKMRAVVDGMLSQTSRSTVGSAGYTWGW